MIKIRLTKRLIRTLVSLSGLLAFVLVIALAPNILSSWTVQSLNSYVDEGLVITDITITECSTLKLGGCHKGKDWFLVDKHLNYNSKGKKLYYELWKQRLFVQKKKISQLTDSDEVIVDLAMGDHTIFTKREKYNKNTPGKYYYNLDVLFGLDAVDPRPGWELIKKPLSIIKTEIPTYFTLYKQSKLAEIPQVKLTIPKSQSNYKILQIADLHFSTDEGECRDQYPEIKNCKADKRTLTFLNKVLEIEKPDLAILTGDQIYGDDSFDAMTTILKVLNPLIEKKIPYALMFGNHDDEGSLSRTEIMHFVQELPYNLAQAGPADIDGVGNYHFQVKDKSDQSVLTFFVLDTHKYSPNPKVLPGYDWIKENQLEYLTQLNKALDYGPKDLKFAFFHIPLPEYRSLHQPYIGNYKEGVTAPKYNTNGRDVLQELGVKVVSVGHDHCNDYCLLDSKNDAHTANDIWLCYGGGSGEGGYGGYGGTTRRLRLFDVELDTSTVKSYKRLETSPEEKFDEQILVRNGEVVNN